MSLTRTLAEWGQHFDPDKKSVANVIELLTQQNPMLNDIPFMEGNETNGYTSTIRTGLPSPTWRKFYGGVQPTKSKVGKVTDTCGMMEARSEIDADLLALNGGSSAYRLQESQAHIEGMNQEAATTLIYGDQTVNPDAFHGLAPRYAFKDAPNVVDAGGSGNNCTSIWLVSWGDLSAHGIFPKGMQAGLMHQDLGENDAVDPENGGKYRVVEDLYKWKLGLTVRDWRTVVRIANIDTTKLGLDKGDANYIDLRKLMIKAKNLIPEAKRGSAVWYANEVIVTAMEIQASDPGNVDIRFGEYNGTSNVLMPQGRPMRQMDAILTTETALGAM